MRSSVVALAALLALIPLQARRTSPGQNKPGLRSSP